LDRVDGAESEWSSCWERSAELEEVVGGGDQGDFGLDGVLAASEDAGDPAVMLGSGEHRLDDLLSSPILAGEVRVGEVGLDRGCEWPWPALCAWRDQHPKAASRSVVICRSFQ
jgi:hypothetical protein